MQHDGEAEIVVASINVDQQLPTLQATRPIHRQNKQWEPLFYTNYFLSGLGELRLDDFKLGDR